MIASMFNSDLKPMQPTAIRKDTKAWKAQVWLSFGAAVTLCATGLAYLPGQDLDRASTRSAPRCCTTSA